MRRYSWLAAFAIPVLTACTGISPNHSSPTRDTNLKSQFETSYLHTHGAQLVTESGQEVELRGINIGGWLVTEDWMCGITDSKDTQSTSGSAGLSGRFAPESLEDRFGPEKAKALIRAWQDHWITSKDLDQIRDGGFNLIRVPFSYRTLQNADGSWILDANGQIDFSRMDWIVREAAARGIYTIFDLHVWPGQHLGSDAIGRPEGSKIRDAMAQLWTAIAAHYRGNGAIAAFDLINEFPGNWGVQQMLSRAVREGDPNRIQAVEGFTFSEFLKLHAAGEFPNSMFSKHLYGSAPLTIEEFTSGLKETLGSPVPVYIGEFLAADFPAATQAMELSNVSWSSWTYKVVDMGSWGLFNYYADLKTDIQKDSFETISTKWSDGLTAWQVPGAPQNHFINDDRRLAKNPESSVPLR